MSLLVVHYLLYFITSFRLSHCLSLFIRLLLVTFSSFFLPFPFLLFSSSQTVHCTNCSLHLYLIPSSSIHLLSCCHCPFLPLLFFYTFSFFYISFHLSYPLSPMAVLGAHYFLYLVTYFQSSPIVQYLYLLLCLPFSFPSPNFLPIFFSLPIPRPY